MTLVGGERTEVQPPTQRDILALWIGVAYALKAGVLLQEGAIETAIAQQLGVDPRIFEESKWRQALERGVYPYLRWNGYAERRPHGVWLLKPKFFADRKTFFTSDVHMADQLMKWRAEYEAQADDDPGGDDLLAIARRRG